MAPVVDGADQPFSNPIAPAHLAYNEDNDKDNLVTTSNLTNADFRKMIMTPAPGKVGTKDKPQVTIANVEREKQKERERRLKDKKKKKGEYLEYKKQIEAREKELAERYRDRADERRLQQKSFEVASASHEASQYVPSAVLSSVADGRKPTIQESKFLGGDMDHTHLVKGLDFALLQKVREENSRTELTQEKSSKPETVKQEEKEDSLTFKSKMGYQVYKILFIHKHPNRNELFAQNRMAYVVELDDEYAETDIPTTLIRSKTETKTGFEKRTLTNNDIVISKLTQILSYLRQGNRYGKQKTRKKDKRVKFEVKAPSTTVPGAEDDIFGGVGDYVPPGIGTKAAKKLEKPSSYFSEVTEKSRLESSTQQEPVRKPDPKIMRLDAPAPADSYMECYPGAMEENGATYDSDEDADYSKMDMGNKKGPLTRWDFEDEDKYNAYMEKREALPKAAFQFGIKMTEGRKTKRNKPADQKQKLDREMQRINQLISKRKGGVVGDGVPEKMAKY